MKVQIISKWLNVVLAAILLVVVFIASGELTAYAAGVSFSNHWLSSGGGVKASYNSTTKVLTISGAGTVEYDRWEAMAQKINSNYFSDGIICWDRDTSEDDMDIVFNGNVKAIKLCGSNRFKGLFRDFSGNIIFNNAVDIASDVTDLTGMFYNATAFNQPVAFDTGNVTDMSYMFYGATSFNQPVDFDTSKVTNMNSMFADATNFNKPINFDTTKVENMYYMFANATSFNHPVNFGTSNVKYMHFMFSGATSFNQRLDFDTGSVVNMRYMFSDATRFNKPINFDTGNVTDMSGMFSGATRFNKSVNFDTSKVEYMYGMFEGATSFDQPVNFDTTKVEKMYSMFANATAFNQPVNFDTRNVTDMRGMFTGAESFNYPVNFDTSKAEYMYDMFNGTTSFNHPVDLDIGTVDSLWNMFKDSAVERVKLNNIPSNVDVFSSGIFKGCTHLKELEFSGLRDVEIDGFSGDYYVVENGGSPIAKDADESYAFNDNQSYKVYLQSEAPLGVPTVTLSKSGSGIKVSWTAVAGATGYQVYRADKRGGPYTKFKTTGGLVYTNTGNLVAGMPYFYKVRHYKNFGLVTFYGQFSDVKGYYAPGELAAPDKPNLTLDRNGNGIRLNWNSQDRIIGYQVFRSLSPDKPFSYLKTASGNATKYTNLSGLTPGRPFYYKMRAYRMAKGVRAYSPFSDIEGMYAGTDEQALGAVSFSLEDNSAVSAPNVRVRWTGVTGADGYCVYRWNGVDKRWIGLKKTGPNARVYTNINGVANHKTNFYGMRTYHISGGTTYYGNIGQSKGFRVDK